MISLNHRHVREQPSTFTISEAHQTFISFLWCVKYKRYKKTTEIQSLFFKVEIKTDMCSTNQFTLLPGHTYSSHSPASLSSQCGKSLRSCQWEVGINDVCYLHYSSHTIFYVTSLFLLIAWKLRTSRS